MRRILAFLILSLVKTLSLVFYRSRFRWLTERPRGHWKKTRLVVFLNHTSLYEPLFVSAFPYSYLWHLAGHLSVPGADITLNRPLVGTFWKLMIPNITSITRKKDASWENFRRSIDEASVIIIAPEGRMKRPGGLDKNGKPMSVKGGVADIIEEVSGGMVLAFSGGLHHVQKPGERFPRIFKTIRMNLAYLDLEDYRRRFPGTPRERKLQIIRDLEARLLRDCPAETSSR